ncbi:hypothetical protein [Nocardioides terrisoli]|uniref:hypothetical protein n=1 Tax=Nocardioides terrisoli TaxID=3388267 RepID=UPI00287BC12D|nr:hypothetical protein [Nocardioides marmorisolisilvae]
MADADPQAGSVVDTEPAPTVIVVSGMHRSGTSALTRVLSLMGSELPEHLIPGRAEKGDDDYWESRPIVDLNEELLEASGTWWGGWQSIDGSAIPEREQWIDRIRSVVRDELGGARLVVVKDPRVSRLLPLWIEGLEAEGYRCVHVVALRHPSRVARSLRRRDNLSSRASMLGWLAHNLDAELYTRDQPRVFVSLEQLGADWRHEVDRIGRALQIDWPRDADDVAAEVDAFVDPARAGGERQPVALVRPIVELLHRWTEDDVRPDDEALLTTWRNRFALCRSVVSPTVVLIRGQRQLLGADRLRGPVRYDAFNVEADQAWIWLRRQFRERGSRPENPSAPADPVSEPTPGRSAVPNRPVLERVRASVRPRTRLRDATARVRGRVGGRAVPPPSIRPGESVRGTTPDGEAPALAPLGFGAAELVTAPTNLGPLMDAVVARAKRTQKPMGLDADYDLVRDNFDYLNFLLSATRLHDAPEEEDPIELVLRRGAKLKHSPDINFSTAAYLERHPERRRGAAASPYLDWLKRGRAAGEIADPIAGVERMAPILGLGEHELIDMLAAKRLDLQDRLRHGKLGEMFARAAEVEPLVGEAWTETCRPRLLPVGSAPVVAQTVALYASQQEADFRRARVVLVTNRPRWGGGRRAEGNITHALSKHIDPREIVVIHTDVSGHSPRGRFPDGVREIDFAGHTAGMSETLAGQTLVALLRSFEADAVVNINSRLLHHAMRPYGRALAASERLFLMFFCNEQLAMGNWVGWGLRQFYRSFDQVEGVITDSDSMRRWLVDTYQLGGNDVERLHVLRAPVDPAIPLAACPTADGDRRPMVFWAGRWDRQKRVDLVLEVARRMPDVDFRLWGEPVLYAGPVPDVPENVELRPPYTHFSELDLSAADAWLYTSGWDGVPSLLLEVAMTGLPLAGSLVGGTEEVLDAEYAWPVAEIEDPAAYEAALREILADRQAARSKARGLRDRLLADRTERAFGDHVARMLLIPDGPEETAR